MSVITRNVWMAAAFLSLWAAAGHPNLCKDLPWIPKLSLNNEGKFDPQIFELLFHHWFRAYL